MDFDFRMQPYRIRAKFEQNQSKRERRELELLTREKESRYNSLMKFVRDNYDRSENNEAIWNAKITEEFKQCVDELELTNNYIHARWFSRFSWCEDIIHPVIRLGDLELLRWICIERKLPVFNSASIVDEIWSAIRYGHFDIADIYASLPDANINFGYRYREHCLLIKCFEDLNSGALLYLARKGVRVEFMEFGQRQEPITLFMDSIGRRRWIRGGVYVKATNEELKKEVEILKILFETGIQQEFELNYWERERVNGFLGADRLLRGNSGIAHKEDKPKLRMVPSAIKIMKKQKDYQHLFKEAMRHLSNRYNFDTVHDK